MQQDLSKVLADLQAQFHKAPHASELRLGLQDYFDAALCTRAADGCVSEEQVNAFCEGLRLFRKLCNAQPPKEDDPCFTVSLSEICENLIFACDLLCAAENKRLFYCGEAELLTVCRPNAVLWSILNLLTNAIAYARGKYIFLDAAQKGHYSVLRVSSEGAFPPSVFETQLTRHGGGLWYAAQTAAIHSGTLLLSHEDIYAHITLTLPRTDLSAPLWETPDFTDWLADRLSPVYTALSAIQTPRF